MSIANFAIAALAALSTAGAAEAASSPPPGSYSVTATPDFAILTGLSPVQEDDLASFSGGQEMIAVTNQNLTALNSGNSVNAASVVNGQVTLEANAFSGFSGLGNFVINTGNNNNLQSSMSVNIVMTPGTP
jgi:hypothetical protein